jgi:predicted metalloendopeptidase
MILSYKTYKTVNDLLIDGKKTLSEKLTDIGGLIAAYRAY